MGNSTGTWQLDLRMGGSTRAAPNNTRFGTIVNSPSLRLIFAQVGGGTHHPITHCRDAMLGVPTLSDKLSGYLFTKKC